MGQSRGILAFICCFVKGLWDGTSSFPASAPPLACRARSANELGRATVEPPGYLNKGKKENNLSWTSCLLSAELIKPSGCMEVTKCCATYLLFRCNDLIPPPPPRQSRVFLQSLGDFCVLAGKTRGPLAGKFELK